MKDSHETRHKIWTASQLALSEIRDRIDLQIDVYVHEHIVNIIANIGSNQVEQIRRWTAYDRKGLSRNLTQG